MNNENSVGKRAINPNNEARARAIAKKKASENPLRVVLLNCHGWVRDTEAVKNDWIWFNSCGDLARVVEVRE